MQEGPYAPPAAAPGAGRRATRWGKVTRCDTGFQRLVGIRCTEPEREKLYGCYAAYSRPLLHTPASHAAPRRYTDERVTPSAPTVGIMTASLAGILLTGIGVAALAGFLPPLGSYAYAIVWWGVLLLADSFNAVSRGLSLWHGNLRHFLTITAPLSVLLWLLFEALNFPAPQWRYRGDIPGMWRKVLFGFAAFSTVIPIMVESWWLIAGRQCAPAGLLRWCRDHRWLCFAAAAVFAMMPFVNDIFWFNQGIWIAPALLLLPSVRTEACSTGTFLRALVGSGLLAGLCWEAFNYPARTHWEYLILPDVPHLFYMPVPGYLGFVAFALTTMAVYETQSRVRPSVPVGILLYGAAIAGLYWLTLLYIESGLWLLP